MTISPGCGSLWTLIVFHVFMVNVLHLYSAFIQICFYNIASHTPIHKHIHTQTAVSAMQGNSQLLGSSWVEESCSGTPRHLARRRKPGNRTSHLSVSRKNLLPPEHLHRHYHEHLSWIIQYNNQKAAPCTCSCLRPVKQNMPIWSMTCCQLLVEPSFCRPATSCSLILMIRLAMPWTSSSLATQEVKSTWATRPRRHMLVVWVTSGLVGSNSTSSYFNEWTHLYKRQAESDQHVESMLEQRHRHGSATHNRLGTGCRVAIGKACFLLVYFSSLVDMSQCLSTK